jgi:ankyrin repeat protein
MGQYTCLKWLLSTRKGKKAVKVTDNEGGTPAHDAADNGQTDCLRLLVDNGADLHVKDKVI